MNILVVNDDGINSRGLAELVEALETKGNVYVAAPDGERSGFSGSITLGRKIHVTPLKYRRTKAAYAIDGTPVDCTKAGIQFFGEAGIKFDIVYSGINLGSNLGRDINYSGTVGAAVEAALSGIPAVALSVDSHTPKHYEASRNIALKILDCMSGKGGGDILGGIRISPGKYLNVNVPHMAEQEIKGVRITTLGGRHYADSLQKCDVEQEQRRGQECGAGQKPEVLLNQYAGMQEHSGDYILDGETVVHGSEKETSDIVAVSRGYVSITPASCDATDHEMIKNSGIV